jgi:8-oxo-dGTP pyrophosphatase MutT (NUDIX family)
VGEIQAVVVDRTHEVEDAAEQIERAWRAAMGAAEARGVRLFDGPMARLDGYEVVGERLVLRLSRTSYRMFVGTNQQRALGRWGYGPETLANPLGLSAALVTGDGKLIFGRRSGRVFYHPGLLHPVAGTLEPQEREDPVAGMAREIAEETGLGAGEYKIVGLLGMVEDVALGQPEAVFDVRTKLSAAEVVARAIRFREEHSGWVAVDVGEVEASTMAEMTPVARGVVELVRGQPMARG